MGSGASTATSSVVYNAARRGDSATVQAALTGIEEGAGRRRLLEWTDRKGRTPLIVAAQKGHINCVLELLRYGANIHHISERDFGGSALHEAVYYKWRSNGIVEALLRHGANPFLKNAHNRTVLDLALIENASKDLFLPWLYAFDRHGFFAEELMVRTQFLNSEPSWVSRWVTVIPLYSTTHPDHRRCLKKTMLIYDGFHSRVPVTSIDLTGAQAQISPDRLNLVLGVAHHQPVGVAASKLENSAWSISFSATFHSGLQSLNRLARVVNENVRPLIEHPPQNVTENIAPEEHAAVHPTDPSTGPVSTLHPSLPGSESGTKGTEVPSQGHTDWSMLSVASSALVPSAIALYNGSSQNDINEGICVVCLDKPQTAGFLHGDSIHRCVCDSCAYLVYLSDRSRCPICRGTIDRIITGIN